jgi:hypothetical protein
VSAKNLNHGTVIEIQPGKDLEREPEMQEIAGVYESMTEREQGRTLEYLGVVTGERTGRRFKVPYPYCMPVQHTRPNFEFYPSTESDKGEGEIE